MASHHCHPHYHHQPPTPPPPCCCRQCHPQPPPSDPNLESALARLLHPAPPLPQPQFSRHRRIQQPSVLVSLIDRIEALESSLYSLSISPPASSLRDAAARVIQAHFRVFLARRSKTLRHLKELASVKSRFTVLRSSLSSVSRLNLVSLSERAMDLLLKLDSIQDNDPMIRDGKRSISRDLDAFLNYIDAIAVKRHHLSISSRVAAKSQPSSSRSSQSRILRQEKQIVDNLRSRVDRIRSLSNVYTNDEEEEEEGEEDEEEEEEEDVELESFENFSDDDNNPRNKIEGFARPPQPRVKKNVTFAENGNVYKIISSKPNLSSSSEDGSSSCIDGDVSDADISEKSKGSSSYLHKDYQEAEMDNVHNNVASPASSDGGVPSSWLRNEPKINIVRESADQGVDFMFSAPLTDKIETREDLMKRRKALKISGQ